MYIIYGYNEKLESCFLELCRVTRGRYFYNHNQCRFVSEIIHISMINTHLIYSVKYDFKHGIQFQF